MVTTVAPADNIGDKRQPMRAWTAEQLFTHRIHAAALYVVRSICEEAGHTIVDSGCNRRTDQYMPSSTRVFMAMPVGVYHPDDLQATLTKLVSEIAKRAGRKYRGRSPFEQRVTFFLYDGIATVNVRVAVTAMI
jgi:hypothetical protein